MKNLFMMIILVFCQVWAGKTETVEIFSDRMNKNVPALIVIPDSYSGENDSLPVILLLHGYGGSYKSWSSKTNLVQQADEFNFIIVCPDGNRNSWYLDSPMEPESQYKTFFINELIPWIKNNFRTNQMGITGLSMGGHGAFYLAIRHPELFDAVSGMSAGVDLTFSTVKWELAKILGPFELYPNRWYDHSVVNMVGLIEEGFMPILIDCGYDDFFIDINRTLHNRLIEKNVLHTYIEKPGAHNWVYWVKSLDEHLSFFENAFYEIKKD
jgi:S-formylglutathione hydrolase FrmB